MTSKYDAWLLALQNRDATLVSLAIISAAVVLAWIGLDWLPARIRQPLRMVYLIGGIVLYLVTFSVSVL